jgi:enterochelin esterase-like enzyme
MSTENQQLQTLIDGELSDLELDAVSGGGHKRYYWYCYHKNGRRYCSFRRRR